MLGCSYGPKLVGSLHLSLVPEHDDIVHKKCGVRYPNIPPVYREEFRARQRGSAGVPGDLESTLH
jgi:hypothetical protein